jgi:tetratricopeptide (TPR) repeat protein
MRSKTFFLSCAWALLAAACGPASGPSASSESAPAQPVVTASAAANAGGATTARTLALSDPGGNAVVDGEIRGLQATVGKLPQHIDSWALLGRAWIRKARETADPGYYLNARACADIILEQAPGNRLAQNLIAQALLNDHKFKEARDVAEEILAKEAEDFQALGTLSDASLELGRYDQAVDAAQRMVSFKPSLPSYVRVSYLAWLRGDTKTALTSARFAIDAGADPRFLEPRAWAIVQAALIFWHQGDHDGAEAGFKQALKEVSEFPPALVGLSSVAMARGDAKRAVDLLERAHRQSPLVDTAWRLGDARAAAGDEKGAQEAYDLAIKEGRRGDHRTLALFFAVKNRNADEAVQLAKDEMEVRPNIYTRDTYAWALYRKGMLKEAREQIDQATALGTKDAMLLYHAGAIRIAAGDKDEGEKLVKEALALNPKFEPTMAPEAEKLLGKQ